MQIRGLILPFFLCFFPLVVLAEGGASVTSAASGLKSVSTLDLEKELANRNTREGRIKTTESNLKKLVNRKSWSKAVIGSVLTGAVTAHPAGLLLGGLVGAFVGRAEKYEKVEEKIANMEQEIIVDEDDFLTDEEVRLASFAEGGESVVTVYEDSEKGVFDENEIASAGNIPVKNESLPDIAITPNALKLKNEYEQEMAATKASEPAKIAKTSNANNTVFGNAEVASLTVKTQTLATTDKPKAGLAACYNSAEERSKGRTRREEIKAMPHCFYMMY